MDNKPIIYSGLEGVTQWQIAARYLHQVPNKEYDIFLENMAICHRCDRKFIKIFSFHKKESEIQLYICHACICELRASGLVNYLYQQEKNIT